MKILLVTAAADWSVADVATGYAHALKALGHDVREFPLSEWIKFMGGRMLDWKSTGQMDEVQQLGSLQLAAEKSVIDAMRHQADLVLIISGIAYHPDALQILHDVLHYKVALVCTESPYNDPEQDYLAQWCDLVTVNDRLALERMKHPNLHYLPHAYDSEVHRPLEVGPEYRSDVFFVGTGFSARQELFEAVDWRGIDLRLFGLWNANRASPLYPYLKDAVLKNSEAVKWYSGTKVAVNLHRTAPGYSANPRVFELAACGAHQLVDNRRPEVAELFGDSICTFGDALDFEDRLRECLADPLHRKRKTRDALERVQGHTFEARARELLTWI